MKSALARCGCCGGGACLSWPELVFYFYPLWVADQQSRFHLWRAGVRSEYVDAGGYRMHYFEALAAERCAGTPLLLVHGLGARGRGLGGDDSGAGGEGFSCLCAGPAGVWAVAEAGCELLDLACRRRRW